MASQNTQIDKQQYRNNRSEVDISQISDSALFQFARFGGVGGRLSGKPPGILGRNPSSPLNFHEDRITDELRRRQTEFFSSQMVTFCVHLRNSNPIHSKLGRSNRWTGHTFTESGKTRFTVINCHQKAKIAFCMKFEGHTNVYNASLLHSIPFLCTGLLKRDFVRLKLPVL